MRNRLFNAILNKPITYFDQSTSGELVSVLWVDVDAINVSSTIHIPNLLRHSVACICSLIGMALLSLRITVLAACTAPLIGLVASLVGNSVARLAREHQSQVSEVTALAAESFASVRVVRAFGKEVWLSHRFASEVQR